MTTMQKIDQNASTMILKYFRRKLVRPSLKSVIFNCHVARNCNRDTSNFRVVINGIWTNEIRSFQLSSHFDLIVNQSVVDNINWP